MFLRVGGSIWEFKIDPNNLRKDTKNGKLYRKKKIENRRKEDQQARQKELQKVVTVFDPATGVLQVKENLSSLVGRGP